LAGQTVSEGFLEWKTSPFMRRLVTRLIGIVPSLAVAVGVGRQGVDTLLVASQVALSIVLPFVIAPLLIVTASHKLMSIQPDAQSSVLQPEEIAPEAYRPPVAPKRSLKDWAIRLNPLRSRGSPEAGVISYANHNLVNWLGWMIFTLVLTANVYAIVQIGMGE